MSSKLRDLPTNVVFDIAKFLKTPKQYHKISKNVWLKSREPEYIDATSKQREEYIKEYAGEIYEEISKLSKKDEILKCFIEIYEDDYDDIIEMFTLAILELYNDYRCEEDVGDDDIYNYIDDILNAIYERINKQKNLYCRGFIVKVFNDMLGLGDDKKSIFYLMSFPKIDKEKIYKNPCVREFVSYLIREYHHKIHMVGKINLKGLSRKFMKNISNKNPDEVNRIIKSFLNI